MTLNQQAASGQVADDVEIAAMVAGKDGLRVLLQPQVDLLTGRIVSAEALARWQHPRLGTVMPADFIPSINRQGLDRKLFERVSVRVIEMLQTMRRAGWPFPLRSTRRPARCPTPGRSKRCCCASAPPSCPPRCCGWS